MKWINKVVKLLSGPKARLIERQVILIRENYCENNRYLLTRNMSNKTTLGLFPFLNKDWRRNKCVILGSLSQSDIKI